MTEWMQTFSGTKFKPLSPVVDDIHIGDIAHSLSLQCRYAGHCLQFYSVAEHSVLIARHLAGSYSPAVALWGLLHDAPEAYLVDVPRPIKPFLPGYAQMEGRLMSAIAKRYALTYGMPSAVKEADSRILNDERIQNMSEPPAPWAGPQEPLGVILQFWSPTEAEHEFLHTFHSLVGDSS